MGGGSTEMESQSLHAMTAKRSQIADAIRLLEDRDASRGGLAVKSLIERLRLKAEWLDKRIEMESGVRRADNAA